MNDAVFSKKHLTYGKELIKEGRIGPLLFSEGTYQVEVREKGKKGESYWPFLQLDDAGGILDCFCTCQEAEEKKECGHLAAAYLKIFNEQTEPLHVRFRGSLWNALCMLASRRHGYDPAVLKKKGQAFEIASVTGKKLFSLQPLNPAEKKRIQEILFHRPEETEETSLKFSKLPPEEIALWKEGKPSPQLLYELSFWSDLAKVLISFQEEGQQYQLLIKEVGSTLPQWIQVRFPSLTVEFYIAEANWPQLIPCLGTVSSPLPLYEFRQRQIQKIRYDQEKKTLLVESVPIEGKTDPELPTEGGISVGQWRYLPKRGDFSPLIPIPFLMRKSFQKTRSEVCFISIPIFYKSIWSMPKSI